MLRRRGIFVQPSERHGEVEVNGYELGIGMKRFLVKPDGVVKLFAPGTDRAEVRERLGGSRILLQVFAETPLGANEIAGLERLAAAVQQGLRNRGEPEPEKDGVEHSRPVYFPRCVLGGERRVTQGGVHRR